MRSTSQYTYPAHQVRFGHVERPKTTQFASNLARRTTQVVEQYNMGKMNRAGLNARITCIYRQEVANPDEAIRLANAFLAKIK